jgi:glycosyltransferase involved in cell wall biosynthesis
VDGFNTWISVANSTISLYLIVEALNKVSVIIPAFNEATTISEVIVVVLASELIDEVIVVDDASTDSTAPLATELGATVISLQQNMGKGNALAVGLREAVNDVVLFLDADLIGLQPQHITDLLTPVLNDEVKMTVGKFYSGEFWTTLSQHITPFLSGQRAIRKEAILDFKNMNELGFGVETALTLFFKRNKLLIKSVLLFNLRHVVKERKFGFFRGFYLRLKMYWQIVRIFFVPKD